MKQRVISAIVVLAIFIPLIIIGGYPFIVGISIVGILGFKELIDLRVKDKGLPLLMRILSTLCFLVIVLSSIKSDSLSYVVDFRYFVGIIFIILCPLVFYHDNKKYNINDALYILGSVFFLGIAFNYLIMLRNFSLNYIVFLLLITIITDTFAQITGMLIGKHKLAPSVSPKKTIEGLIGGSLFGTFVSSCFYITIFDYTGNIFILVFIVLMLTLIGQLGDLVFSSIKRYYGVKDYSNIMPGHGGVLDRLDSILFVLLAFSFIIGVL
ncbi:MAG: phosphatidate cytidylyltransferase [Bacilli bacterium]